MYNKKLLSKIDLGKSTKINPYKKDIIYDPMGQWKYPGQPTRIPSSNITMKGVNYPVLAVTDNGQKKMMQPGQDYKFPGAKYVDEFPQAKKGGSLNSKKYTRSLDGIGSLFRESALFKKPKSSKKKLFHPHAKYYAEGGEEENSKPCPTGYIYSVELGHCIPNAEYRIIESEVDPEAAIVENIEYKKANDYLTQYYNSPKYKEMLKNSSSSPEGYKWLLESRNKQLANTPPLQIAPQPSNSPDTGGQSWSNTGQIELFPLGFGTRGNLLHELSHSSDRPLPGHSQRLIPKSDTDYINKHKGKVLGDSRDYHNNKQWYNDPNAQKNYKEFYSDYVGEDTETRARLNEIRRGAKENGLYDPFTEGVSNDVYLNKLKNFQFEKGDKSGFDPMKQLQGTYSDEEIIWMLNHISKNEDKKEEEGNQSFAKKGGALNRFIGGGDPDPLDPHQVFLKNWYENRVFPKELEKARPAILNQFNQSFPPYVVTDKLPADALAAYNNINNTVELNQNYPKEVQESSKTHELNHWATDTADDFLNEPHGYLIEDNIINPKNINTGSPESDTYTKDNFEYLVSPREVHSRIMTFRELAGFKPNQIITEKDVEDYLNKAGDKLDPDIKDLKNVTKGNKAMVELLNGMALNNTPISENNIQYTKKGGALNKFVDGGEEDFYSIPGNKSVYRKVNGNWQVDSNRSGNFQPLSKGDVAARTAVLNTQAKQLFDPMYSDMFNTKKAGYKSVPKEQPPIKKQTVQDNKAQESFNNNFKVSDASNAEKIKNAIEQDKQKFIQLGKEQGFEVTQEDLDNVETRGWQHYGNVGLDYTPPTVSQEDQANKVIFDEQPKNLGVLDYIEKGWDVATNPLDYASYFMKPNGTAKTPWNMRDYEQRLAQAGVSDPIIDNNPVTSALDFASYFTPVGLYGQAIKMIPDTFESIGNAIENPSWNNTGSAAWDVAMNVLTAVGGKSPLKVLKAEKQIFEDAAFAADFMKGKGPRPNPFNTGNGLLPVSLAKESISILPTAPITDISTALKTSEILKPSIAGLTEEVNAVRPMTDPSYLDDAAVTDLIDDARLNNIQQWQTPEGKARLQKMIKSTPSLKGQTPESMVEGVKSMNVASRVLTKSENRKKELTAILDDLDVQHENGIITEQQWANNVMFAEHELGSIEDVIESINKDINKNGFYSARENQIHVQGNKFTEPEVKRITSHELGHFLNSAGETNLDGMLGDLDLVTDTSHQLSLKGINPLTEFTQSYNEFGQGNNNYIKKSLDYFKTGSEGTEKIPYLVEVRKDMLEKGVINSEYDKITPAMLKKHFKDYKNAQGEKYPLRLYDIIKDKPENFSKLSKVLDQLPMILQIAGLTDSIFGDDDIDTKEAGFSFLIGALTKGKSKLGRVNKGLKRFTSAGRSAILGESKGLIKAQDDLINLQRQTQSDWSAYNHAYLDPKVAQLENEYNNIQRKINHGLDAGTISNERILKHYQKNLPKIQEQLKNVTQTEKGIKTNNTNKLDYVTDTGEKPIVSFKTGDFVNATVDLPGNQSKYSIENNKLEIANNNNTNPAVSSEYIDLLNDNINHVESTTGAKVFGSAVGVTKGGLPHLTGDIDALILDTDYARNVKGKLEQVSVNKGPAKVHEIGVNKGTQGHIDFNVIHTNPDGTIKPVWTYNGVEARSLEMELFRQFFPDEFYAAQKEAIKNGGLTITDPSKLNIKIPISAKEFMDKIDPAVKTVVDAYESSKVKHTNRIDTYINYGNIDVVSKAQETYVKSLVGSKGTVGAQLPIEALSDVELNKEALKKMEFIGDIDFVANDPNRMQLALNDYYINHTVVSRYVQGKGSLQNVESAFKKWDQVHAGGSGHGWGLNTVKLGDPEHWQGNILGQLQYGIKTDTSSVLSYIDSINHATGNKLFSQQEKSEIYKIIEKHTNPEHATKQMESVNTTVSLLHLYNKLASDNYVNHLFENTNVDIQKIFNDITKKLGIRATGDTTYGNSTYSSMLGEFDEATDLLEYSILSMALKPKSSLLRKKVFDANSPIQSVNDPDLIKTIGDYKKIENYLNGGLKKSEDRHAQLMEEIKRLDVIRKEKIEKMLAKHKPELQKEIDDAKNKIKEFEKEAQRIVEERRKIVDKLHDISEFKKSIAPLSLLVGGSALGAWVIGREVNRKKNPWDTDQLSKKESEYINNNKSIERWPSGQPIEYHQTVGDQMFGSPPEIKPPKKRFKNGGLINFGNDKLSKFTQ